MRTKSIRKKRVNVVTLGCSKNIFDSEILMAQLKGDGKYDVIHEADAQNDDIIIINTCGFIDKAKQESIDTILRFADARTRGDISKLYVTGCLSERYKDDLTVEVPEVDAWFGTRELPRLLKTLKADYKKELVGERLLTTPAHYAYFKIAEGCDRPCSFCAIPIMRGKHVSTPMEDLVKAAESLAANGTSELILIAQDLTYYGIDLYGKRTLHELLDRLADVKGIRWIRLHYAYPTGFPLEVLDVMNRRDNICKYLDMPLQHISDPVLKSMRRGTTREKTTRLLETIRERVPGIAIRTTLIAGYPGETQKDFDILARWVEETKFERLGIFTYSHEENTHAFGLTDDVPEEEKIRRAGEIMEIQQEISMAHNQRMVGNQYDVLIDRIENNIAIGRTQYDSPEVDNEVLIPDNNYKPGQFLRAKIISASDYDLDGEVLD